MFDNAECNVHNHKCQNQFLFKWFKNYLLGGRLGDALPPTTESREVCLEYEGLEPGPVGDIGADPARGMSLICCDSDNRRGSVEDEALDGAAGSE